MSWNPALDPSIPTGDAVDAIETVIVPRARDLGGFEVRRALPSEAWRAGDWAHGRFQLPPHDDAEFIPAPER